MANHSGVGTKFVSVNLNKSYGSASSRNNSSTYGQAAASRGGGGGGGSGMVVLSRPRSSSQKPGSKLSVPPPLNLPSLRKEHERFDSSSTGGGLVGRAGSVSAARPTSSSVGWTKPVNVFTQDNSSGTSDKFDQSVGVIDSSMKGGSAYVPSSARFGGAGLLPSLQAQLADKAAVLRGEDFPSLRASLPSGTAAGPAQKQKDSTHNQKHKQLLSDEMPGELRDGPSSSPEVDTTHHCSCENELNGNGGESYRSGGLPMTGKGPKPEEFFPDPLPLLHVNPRSDWADDERDTGHRFVDRSRDYGFSNNEAYWERDFDMPRSRLLPHKRADNQFQWWGKREDENVKTSHGEVPKSDSFVKAPIREGNSWRAPPLPKDGYDDAVGERTMDNNKYVHPRVSEYSRDSATVKQEFNSGRRDAFGPGHRWFDSVESSNTRGNTRDFYSNEQSNRYKGYALQNSSGPKSLISPSGKGLHMNDSVLEVGLEKRAFSNGERTNPVDTFLVPASFDEQDPLSSGLVGVIKRKKDVKQADFHDPVRESFEAELERVQKMQEKERQRIVEEQERALERAQREEEERQRLIREEEEQRRRVEEAAREAAWKAEQDRLDAIRRAEEQKIIREEEKRHVLMEEERRKQAAKQKLLELEARMANKKAESVQDNSSAFASDQKGMEKDCSRVGEFESWEDSERLVERVMTSVSSDFPGPDRSSEPGHQSQSVRDRDSGLKPANAWRRDVFEGGNNNSSFVYQDNDHHSPSRDGSVGGRVFPKKDFHGRLGYTAPKNYYRDGNQETHPENYLHPKGQKWNASAGVDPYSRSMDTDSEFHEKFYQVNAHSPYSERLSSDGDELYPYGRSRYSMRQPRVLPPPSLVPIQKTSFQGEAGRPGSSTSMPYHSSSGNESNVQTMCYNDPQERIETPEIADVVPKNTEQMEEDSQSSLSVSSTPNSPPQLSRDDLDESEDSPMVSATEGRLIVSDTISGKDTVIAGSGLRSDIDEDWSIENNVELQDQEEYDDDDGYQEEDEVNVKDGRNIDLNREFDNLNIADKGSLDMMENLVLGFDEGVEVGLPNVGFERSSQHEDGAFVEQEEPVDGSSKQPSDNSLRCIQEAGMAVPDSTFRPINMNTHTVQSSELLDTINGSTSYPVHCQQMSLSSAKFSSNPSAGQSVVSSIPVDASPTDLPIKLQFGRFSGSPLIASPISAIQIGSIQMHLPIRPPVNPSLTQVHQSRAPLFQFGQLRHMTPPISQGIVPMAPQVSFVQPNVQVHYNLNQGSGGHLLFQPKQEGLASNKIKEDVSSISVGGGNSVVQEKVPKMSNAIMPEAGDKERFSGLESFRQSNGTVSKGLHYSEDSRDSRAQGQRSGVKSKRYAFVARNSSVGPTFPAPEASRSNSGTFQRRPRRTVQRTEFRVRGNVANSANFTGKNVEIFERSGSEKGGSANKSEKPMVELEPLSSIQQATKDFNVDRKMEKESSRGIESNRQSLEMNLKTNIVSEEDFDAPLQSGIVRVFKQPGIEAPSDEDDFIQVKSKKQMLNVRRERREKEIKAKSQVVKAPRKIGSISSSAVFSGMSNAKSATSGGEVAKNTRSDVPEGRGLTKVETVKGFTSPVSQPLAPMGTPGMTSSSAVFSGMSNAKSATSGGEVAKNTRSDVPEGRSLTKVETFKGFTSPVSQPLAPMGTPGMTSDVQADKSPQITKSTQTSASSVIPDNGKGLGPGLASETTNKTMDDVQTSLGSWGNSHINPQVMALTQTQLDEAMRPGRIDSHVTSTDDRSSSVVNPIMPSSSILMKDKSFSSTASPVNSLLAGEKIQFGAVTSPTVLPPSGRAVSHIIRAPGLSRSDLQISQSLSTSESDCNLLFEMDKHQNEPCVHLIDSEAEAEAAASAVAVAAMGGDENLSVSDSKTFRSADISGVTEGVASDKLLSSQSRAEESLSVFLPADLSIDTPPMSLWPPLPSPQSSSGQMFSHFPRGPSSQFPFYEMGPMLGPPIYAFSPHDESGGTQSQPQKSDTTGSGLLGAWQQFHSGTDSFYGPPARFPGSYIGPDAGIRAIQGPPHMVVYNHFPVGQFGQVGLSFMGTTYIPSGRQPDWKQNHTLSNREGDIKNNNMDSGQHNPPGVVSPAQNLAHPTQLLPVPSPFAVFDGSPFQSSPDISVQGRWPHVSSSPFHSIPLSMPLQQQEAGVLNSQNNHGRTPSEQLSTANTFPEPRTSTTSDCSHTFPIPTDSSSTQFPDDLGLVYSSNLSVAVSYAPSSTIEHTAKMDDVQSGANNNNTGHNMNACKTQEPKNLPGQQQYSHHSMGYGYQRNRMGYNHGRNNSMGMDKSFPFKTKQIYVAKQTMNGASGMG